MKKLISLLLATGMVMSLAACGGSGKDSSSGATKETADTAVADEDLDYEYGDHFYSETPVTYTMFFNDNPAYPMTDAWQTEGIFKAIEDATNVHLDLTIVDNSNYTDKVSLAVSSGEATNIIPNINTDNTYVSGLRIVPVSQ